MTISSVSKVGIPVVAAIIIAGCASMGSIYSTCDQKSDKFSDVAVCTKAALRADSRYGFHNGYIAHANRAMAALDFLDEKVTTGAITEKEARYKMQEILASMQREIAAQVNAINASTPSNTSVRTNCTTYGSNTNCVSR
jgi:hypothetical protein